MPENVQTVEVSEAEGSVVPEVGVVVDTEVVAVVVPVITAVSKVTWPESARVEDPVAVVVALTRPVITATRPAISLGTVPKATAEEVALVVVEGRAPVTTVVVPAISPEIVQISKVVVAAAAVVAAAVVNASSVRKLVTLLVTVPTAVVIDRKNVKSNATDVARWVTWLVIVHLMSKLHSNTAKREPGHNDISLSSSMY